MEDKLVDDAWELVWVHNGVKEDLQAWRNPPIDNHMLAEVATNGYKVCITGYLWICVPRMLLPGLNMAEERHKFVSVCLLKRRHWNVAQVCELNTFYLPPKETNRAFQNTASVNSLLLSDTHSNPKLHIFQVKSFHFLGSMSFEKKSHCTEHLFIWQTRWIR